MEFFWLLILGLVLTIFTLTLRPKDGLPTDEGRWTRVKIRVNSDCLAGWRYIGTEGVRYYDINKKEIPVEEFIKIVENLDSKPYNQIPKP
jgi:hypothetical protein